MHDTCQKIASFLYKHQGLSGKGQKNVISLYDRSTPSTVNSLIQVDWLQVNLCKSAHLCCYFHSNIRIALSCWIRPVFFQHAMSISRHLFLTHIIWEFRVIQWNWLAITVAICCTYGCLPVRTTHNSHFRTQQSNCLNLLRKKSYEY